MKTKNYINNKQWLKVLSVIMGLGFVIASCTDYLTVDPGINGKYMSANFYQDSTQCYSALGAAYGAVRVNAGCFYNQIAVMNCGSDECYCGGGSPTDGSGMQNFSNYTMDASNVGFPTNSASAASTNGPAYLWYSYYLGIANANTLLDNIGSVPMSDALKARMIAECKALRAYYYFNLVRMWGNIPVFTQAITGATLYDGKQSTIAGVYAQIEQDLTEAIPDLPLPNSFKASDAGRLTQGAATALLGKVYLYEGDGVPGAKNPDGSDAFPGDPSKYTLAWQTLAQVNGSQSGTTFSSPFGYQLLTNYNDLWSNKTTAANPIFGNAPGKFNSESIFEDVHTNQAKNGWASSSRGEVNYMPYFMGNMMNTMVGPRSYKILAKANNPAPVLSTAGNWSFNVITPECYNFMKNNMKGTDKRFDYSIFDADALLKAGYITYDYGPSTPGGGTANMNTGYFLYKFMPLVSDEGHLGGDVVLNYQQDTYIIRLADTYLMEVEALLKSGGDATRALALVNAVRLRAGAPPLTGTLTLQQIWDERRLEFMGEGFRWFDLVRTGQAAAVLKPRGFQANKNELFPIPTTELSNKNFQQNYGY